MKELFDTHTTTCRPGWQRTGSEMSTNYFEAPGGNRTVERRFVAPFAEANREEDCRAAWAFFDSNPA